MIVNFTTNMTVNDDGQIVSRTSTDQDIVAASPITYTRAESAQVAACIVDRRLRDGSWSGAETLNEFVARIFPPKPKEPDDEQKRWTG